MQDPPGRREATGGISSFGEKNLQTTKANRNRLAFVF
jgi:hypothetical protein